MILQQRAALGCSYDQLRQMLILQKTVQLTTLCEKQNKYNVISLMCDRRVALAVSLKKMCILYDNHVSMVDIKI